MTIRIEIFGENALEALDELRCFARGVEGQSAPQYEMRTDTISADDMKRAQEIVRKTAEATASPEATADEAPKRERGKPSPGRARRTKEEIAEDEAADAANAEPAEPQPNISAEPENRVDPAEAEQDAQDEAADEANASYEPSHTRDHVRAAMLVYQTAYGTPALMADMTAILNEEYPAGNVTKLSEIPDATADFAKITARLNDALANNTFSRDKV